MLAIQRTGNCLVIITPPLTVTLTQAVNEAAIIQHSHVYTISAIGDEKATFSTRYNSTDDH